MYSTLRSASIHESLRSAMSAFEASEVGTRPLRSIASRSVRSSSSETLFGKPRRLWNPITSTPGPMPRRPTSSMRLPSVYCPASHSLVME
jgi:hypothetical protein